MKVLLLAPLLLCSCVATSGALNKLSLEIADASAAAAFAKATAEDVTSTQADIDAAMALVAAEGKEVAAAVGELQDAVIADAKGFSGMGGGADGGLIGLGLTGLAWWMRDRRKRLGQDPLQRADVPTPPTTS